MMESMAGLAECSLCVQDLSLSETSLSTVRGVVFHEGCMDRLGADVPQK